MNPRKATALVLRVFEFSESSSVVTLLTREEGKLRALAKGARRPKGPFDAALDLLCLCRVVFLRKSSEGLHLLTEAKLERRFRVPDLAGLYAGYYVAELLDSLTDDDDPHPELFDLAQHTLAALSQSASASALVLAFEMQTLKILGHSPTWSTCAECGRDVDRQRSIPFGLHAGGVLCPSCRPGQRHVIAVPPAVAETLEQLAAVGLTAAGGEIPRQVYGPARGLISQLVAHLLGHRPKLHPYLGMLSR